MTARPVVRQLLGPGLCLCPGWPAVRSPAAAGAVCRDGGYADHEGQGPWLAERSISAPRPPRRGAGSRGAWPGALPHAHSAISRAGRREENGHGNGSWGHEPHAGGATYPGCAARWTRRRSRSGSLPHAAAA